MNKSDLIDAVAGVSDISKAAATKAVEAMTNSISAALASGDQVTIVGFGTFAVQSRPARSGRNPKTGETIQIAAVNVPKFKAGKGLKDAVN